MKTLFFHCTLLLILISSGLASVIRNNDQLSLKSAVVKDEGRSKRQSADVYQVDYTDFFVIPESGPSGPQMSGPYYLDFSSPPNPAIAMPTDDGNTMPNEVQKQQGVNKMDAYNVYKPFSNFEDYYSSKFFAVALAKEINSCDQRLYMCMLGQDAASRRKYLGDLKQNLVLYWGTELYTIFMNEAEDSHTAQYCWDKFNCLEKK